MPPEKKTSQRLENPGPHKPAGDLGVPTAGLEEVQVPSATSLVRETQAFLALASIHGVGPKTLTEIAESGLRYTELLENGPSETSHHLRRIAQKGDPSAANWKQLRELALSRSKRLMDELGRLGVKVLLREDPQYPKRLLELPRPPHWLFVQGDPTVLGTTSLAVVGTRSPSADGIFLAQYIGACLADWGVATVSGLASGIDQAAHEFSLRANVPTIAVLGTGVLDNYPRGSEQLRQRIVDAGGAITTEYLPNASFSAENFVQRNRLQAALGSVLIPVEWQRRSGTAHTVRFATQLSKPIACLRLADWEPQRVSLLPGLGLETGEIFTVPRDQAKLDKFITQSINGPSTQRRGQLSFFDEA